MRTVAVLLLSAYLCACSANLSIKSALRETLTQGDLDNIRRLGSLPTDQSYEKYSVTVEATELRAVLSSESTVFLNVADCGNMSNDFPAVAFYAGIPLDEGYRAAIEQLEGTSGEVSLIGYVPQTFSRQLRSACVRLSGGSYLGRRVTSGVMPVGDAQSQTFRIANELHNTEHQNLAPKSGNGPIHPTPHEGALRLGRGALKYSACSRTMRLAPRLRANPLL